jgi:hypothetical protein
MLARFAFGLALSLTAGSACAAAADAPAQLHPMEPISARFTLTAGF